MTNPRVKVHKRDPLVPIPLLAGLVITALFLLAANLLGWAEMPGFLGSFAPRLVDLNLVAQGLLLIVLTASLVLIKQKRTRPHRNLLTAVVFFNILLTIFIMAGRLLTIYSPGNYGALQIAHSLIGLTAILIGLYLVLRMDNRLPSKWKIKQWKLLMQIDWTLFFLVSVLGFILYRMLYVL